MTTQLAKEIGLLRALARNLAVRPLPAGEITEDFLRTEAIVRAKRQDGTLIVVLQPGGEAFANLAESIILRWPAMERGLIFGNLESELFDYLAAGYVGRQSTTIAVADVSALFRHFEIWFQKLAMPRRFFVPCVISPWPAPRFSIGPVDFIFIDEVSRSEWYPGSNPHDILSRQGFEAMLELMRNTHANWLARVSVDGCESRRAEEVGSLAIDLALVTLQVAAPDLGTRTMCRLDARRGVQAMRTVSESEGELRESWTRREPGLAIGSGTLADILRRTAPVVTAVGRCVTSFATGRFRLPNLERAWCDGAYWLHEALAEPLDSIAVAKLETALEVLLCAENPSGSEMQIQKVLETFYSLNPNDPIRKGSTTTAKQFARSVVRDRSRILHGTFSTLNVRLTVTREALERFVIPVIRQVAIDLERYAVSPAPIDKIGDFLSWVSANPYS